MRSHTLCVSGVTLARFRRVITVSWALLLSILVALSVRTPVPSEVSGALDRAEHPHAGGPDRPASTLASVERVPVASASHAGIARAQTVRPGQTPAGLVSEDWAQMMRHVRESEYEVSRRAAPGTQSRLQAPNRQNGFRTFFDADGVRVVPRKSGEASWEATFRLAALGAPGAMAMHNVVGEPEVRGNRVEYRRLGLTEWWVNRASGLEHGFTLESPPETGAEQLRLEITVGGGFEVEDGKDGAAVVLRKDACELQYSGLEVKDAKGRELSAWMRGAGNRIEVAVDVAGAAWPVTVDPTLTQVAKATASDGAAFDLFGVSVAVSGDTAVVGAILDDVGTNVDQGSAYVFVRSAGGWSEEQKLTATDGAADDRFGASVAVSGDTAVVSAIFDDVGTNVDQGSAYVFVRSAGVWSEQQKLMASDGAAGDEFGNAVSISGETAVVGALSDDVGTNFNQGSAYVFVRNAGVWSEQQKLTATDGAVGDEFGVSVEVSGDTAVAGAHIDEVGTNHGQGSAYVFVRGAGVWSEQQKLTATDGAVEDRFGVSVAVSGDTAVVGASQDDVVHLTQGSAYVFVRSAGVWSEQQKLTASDGADADRFGSSVAVSGDTAVVAAFPDVLLSFRQGSAYVFSRSAGVWSEQQKLTASDGTADDGFGGSVALSGDTAVVGAFGSDVEGNVDQGSAYVFEPVAELSVAKTDGMLAVAPGTLVTYAIVASNAGPSVATGATVADTFPVELTGVTWTCAASSGSNCITASGVGNINQSVDLAVGGTATFTATGTLSSSATGMLVNTATVTPSGVSDPTFGNNTASDVDTIVPGAEISAIKTVSGTFETGAAVSYSVVLTNDGAAQADNPGDEFTDTLPAALTLVSANATAGFVGTFANTVTWNGSLAGGASVTITINASINAGTEGAVVSNQGTVNYDADDNGTNEASALTDDPGQPGASNPTVLFVGSGAVDFFTLPPCRILDTRNAAGPLGGPALIAQNDRPFTVTGTCGIPATAKAISVNLAVTQPTIAGNLRLRPGGVPVPLVSSINYIAGQTRSNNAVLALNATGQIAVFCGQASGTVHFILDVNGYFE